MDKGEKSEMLMALLQGFIMVVIIGIAYLRSSYSAANAPVTGLAASAFFENYPRCCCGQAEAFSPKGPNCDTLAVDNLAECSARGRCLHQGDLAAFGHQSLEWIASHDLVSIFDISDPNGNHFQEKYSGKTIQISAGAIQFNATIADTCVDSSCKGCCTRNARKQGVSFLADLEYHTMQRHFGSAEQLPPKISFVIF